MSAVLARDRAHIDEAWRYTILALIDRCEAAEEQSAYLLGENVRLRKVNHALHKRLRGAKEESQAPAQPDRYGHEYGPGHDGDEGYGRCIHCDCRENTEESVHQCTQHERGGGLEELEDRYTTQVRVALKALAKLDVLRERLTELEAKTAAAEARAECAEANHETVLDQRDALRERLGTAEKLLMAQYAQTHAFLVERDTKEATP
ncbi:hypothetical protein LCGC14_2720110 [marine sediment metagenome]|uniref:Uncharacterized protein n=1 Tax=marine sediment metagenome TaxID=412755 RepID=A0A0F9C215_9ZZZZ